MKKTLCALLGALVLVPMAGGSTLAGDARTPVYVEGNKPIAPYSPGIKLANGMLFVSGQIPYVNGEIPEEARNDVSAQTRIVMENLESVLKEAGYSFDDVVRATVFMTDMGNYGAFNKVYGTYWGEDSVPPARAAVEVGALPGSKPGAPVLVEVSMIAAK
ncbi:Rid family hydrolase [Roseibium sp. HPY-6]|uniref:RidA family protein n=1 Tax=Roseibium sp. HPY-6 TaxID=3229852 RepID=UPI00338FA49E